MSCKLSDHESIARTRRRARHPIDRNNPTVSGSASHLPVSAAAAGEKRDGDRGKTVSATIVCSTTRLYRATVDSLVPTRTMSLRFDRSGFSGMLSGNGYPFINGTRLEHRDTSICCRRRGVIGVVVHSTVGKSNNKSFDPVFPVRLVAAAVAVATVAWSLAGLM